MRDQDLPLSRGRSIPAWALEFRTSRASGPGGQHVNKTETKVQLLLECRGLVFLDPGSRERLYRLAGRNVDADGRIFVVCQDHRDLLRNLELAREKLALLVETCLVAPKRRVATKPTRGSQRRRLEDKAHRAKTKANRGRAGED